MAQVLTPQQENWGNRKYDHNTFKTIAKRGPVATSGKQDIPKHTKNDIYKVHMKGRLAETARKQESFQKTTTENPNTFAARQLRRRPQVQAEKVMALRRRSLR